MGFLFEWETLLFLAFWGFMAWGLLGGVEHDRQELIEDMKEAVKNGKS